MAIVVAARGARFSRELGTEAKAVVIKVCRETGARLSRDVRSARRPGHSGGRVSGVPPPPPGFLKCRISFQR
jgi:hypothetical protein